MTVELPQDKIDTIVDLATEIYHSTSPVAIRLLSKFIGYLVSSFPAVELGPLCYRSLEKDKIQGLKENNFSYDAKAILSDQSKQDLLWWIKCIHVNCSKPIEPRTQSVLLFTDASDEEFGSHVTSLSDGSILDFTQGNWSPIESCCHVNVNEIIAVKFALFSLFPNASSSVIGVRCDNSRVVSKTTHEPPRAKTFITTTYHEPPRAKNLSTGITTSQKLRKTINHEPNIDNSR